LRYRSRFDSAEGWGVQITNEGVIAMLEIELYGGSDEPRVELAQAAELVSPGWLVHALLRAGATVGLGVDVVDGRSSWIGQLVARSTRRLPAGPADRALALGVPSLRLLLPDLFSVGAAGDDASLLTAALVRRLDGLDGRPVWEDEFLVAAGRVWLRRDLYWLGLALWLLLYWRGRGLPGREFRWLFLVAWLVVPVFAAVLLTVPAAVAAWRPGGRRWIGLVGLVPAALFGLRLIAVLLDGHQLVVAGLPAALVVAAMGAFIWSQVGKSSPVVGTEAGL